MVSLWLKIIIIIIIIITDLLSRAVVKMSLLRPRPGLARTESRSSLNGISVKIAS